MFNIILSDQVSFDILSYKIAVWGTIYFSPTSLELFMRAEGGEWSYIRIMS